MPHELLLRVHLLADFERLLEKDELENALARPESRLRVVERVDFGAEKVLDFVRLKKRLVVVVEDVVLLRV